MTAIPRVLQERYVFEGTWHSQGSRSIFPQKVVQRCDLKGDSRSKRQEMALER